MDPAHHRLLFAHYPRATKKTCPEARQTSPLPFLGKVWRSLHLLSLIETYTLSVLIDLEADWHCIIAHPRRGNNDQLKIEMEIGRASCREGEQNSDVSGAATEDRA